MASVIEKKQLKLIIDSNGIRQLIYILLEFVFSKPDDGKYEQQFSVL